MNGEISKTFRFSLKDSSVLTINYTGVSENENKSQEEFEHELSEFIRFWDYSQDIGVIVASIRSIFKNYEEKSLTVNIRHYDQKERQIRYLDDQMEYRELEMLYFDNEAMAFQGKYFNSHIDINCSPFPSLSKISLEWQIEKVNEFLNHIANLEENRDKQDDLKLAREVKKGIGEKRE